MNSKFMLIRNRKVLRNFYDDHVTEITIMKSGWKGRFLVIYEFGDVDQVKIDLFSEQQLLRNFDDLTKEDLNKLLS